MTRERWAMILFFFFFLIGVVRDPKGRSAKIAKNRPFLIIFGGLLGYLWIFDRFLEYLG
jgi:hypothetical protein